LIVKRSFDCCGITKEYDEWGVGMISDNFFAVCQGFINNLTIFIKELKKNEKEAADEAINNPYLDDYLIELKDLFFNEVINEKISEYI
jgi:hypothetical protein